MTRGSMFSRAAVAIFAAINVAGGIYAVIMGEMMHATAHVALLAGTYMVWPMASRRDRADRLAGATNIHPQLDHLQQSLDAIAVEVERIGEGQRFINNLHQEKVDAKR